MTKTVLVVDDEKEVLNSLKRAFRSNLKDCDVITARDGKEGLEIFKRNPSLDLIITDFTMAERNGIDMTRGIRELNKDVPIVMFTGIYSEDFRDTAKKAGVTEVYEKPYKIDIIKKYL